MQRNGPFFASSQATSAALGLFSAGLNGLAIGITGGIQASVNASRSGRSSQRDSLLAFLRDLSEELGRIKAPDDVSFNLMPLLDDSTKDALKTTADGIAIAVAGTTVTPTGAVVHVSQSALDLSAAIQGLIVSLDGQKNSTHLEALTLDSQKNDAHAFSAHCKSLDDQIRVICGKATQKINEEVNDNSHNSVAQTSAVTLGTGPFTLASAVSASLDCIGATLRENSAMVLSIHEESVASKEEKNVYHALSLVSESKNSDETLGALQKLEEALSDFGRANDMSNQHSVSTPYSFVCLRAMTSVPFITALRGIVSSTVAAKLVTRQIANDDIKPFSLSTGIAADASTILFGADSHFANVKSVTKRVQNWIEKMDRDLNEVDFRDRAAIATSAQSSAVLSGLLSATPLSLTDFVGVFSREISGAIHSLVKDQGTHQQSTHALKTDKDRSGANLDALIIQVSQIQERLERCEALGVSAPVTLGATHVVSSGALVATLNSMAGIYSVIRELQTFGNEPSRATKLDANEIQEAKQEKARMIESHQDSANSTGTGSVSENLSLHNGLLSIMERIVLTHRSGKNFIDEAQPGNARPDLDSSAKSMLGNGTGFLSGALGTLALISLHSGIGVETFFRGLSIATQKSNGAATAGPDRSEISGAKFNLSSASNTTRKAEEFESSASQTLSSATYHTAEALSSRSLTVALCQSGVLREALSRLSNENKREEGAAEDRPGFVNDDLLNKLAGEILGVLNQAAEPNGFVKGLNEDMASQLHSVTQSSIASALSTHSVFILPFLQSSAAAKVASKKSKEHRNDDVVVSSLPAQTISTGSNILQDFTRNCIEQLKKQAVSSEDNQLHPLNQTHESSKHVNASTLVATCCVSLLCDELLEMSLASRSVTLLQRDKIMEASEKSTQIASKNTQESASEIKEDSQLGEAISVTQTASALRLTLSRIGNSLKNFASELQNESDKLKFLEEKGELHSSQRTLMQSLCSSFSQCASNMTAVAGMLSMLPVSSAGVIDDIRRCIHELDAQLQIDPLGSGSCAASTHETGSESYLVTGITTDSTVNLLIIMTKLLLQSVLLGAEGTLSIAKILEIFSIHPRVDQALTLETAALREPNGLTRNMKSLMARVAVTATGATVTVSGSDDTASIKHTIINGQKTTDERIEQLNMLEDDEDKDTSKLGLKEFYQVMIEVLVENKSALSGCSIENKKVYIADIVERFNQDGIELSNLHSRNKGIDLPPHLEKYRPANGKNRPNHFISDNKFLGCDNAKELMSSFIVMAAADLTLLDQFKAALMARSKTMSQSVNGEWNFLLKYVEDEHKLKTMRSRLLHPKQSIEMTFKKDAYSLEADASSTHSLRMG